MTRTEQKEKQNKKYLEKKETLLKMISVCDSVIEGSTEKNACIEAGIDLSNWRKLLNSIELKKSKKEIIPIEDANFSIKVYNFLKQIGVTTINEFEGLSDDEIRSIHQEIFINDNIFNEIKRAKVYFGF